MTNCNSAWTISARSACPVSAARRASGPDDCELPSVFAQLAPGQEHQQQADNQSRGGEPVHCCKVVLRPVVAPYPSGARAPPSSAARRAERSLPARSRCNRWLSRPGASSCAASAAPKQRVGKVLASDRSTSPCRGAGSRQPLPWPPIPGTAQQPQPASPWRPLAQHGIEPVHNLLCKHLTDPIPASRPGLPVPTICRVASYQPQPLSSRPALLWLSCEPCSGCIEDGFSGAPLCPSIDTRPRGTQPLTSRSASLGGGCTGHDMPPRADRRGRHRP
jgi:hypothetical protein